MKVLAWTTNRIGPIGHADVVDPEHGPVEGRFFKRLAIHGRVFEEPTSFAKVDAINPKAPRQGALTA
jgi:hypothetical protein